jgi:hypothetical protein
MAINKIQTKVVIQKKTSNKKCEDIEFSPTGVDVLQDGECVGEICLESETDGFVFNVNIRKVVETFFTIEELQTIIQKMIELNSVNGLL